MLRLVIKLGFIDIAIEVSDHYIYLDFPITGNLVQALNVFRYLEIYSVIDIAFDPCHQHVTSDQNIRSKVQAMKDLYPDDGE